MDKIFVYKCCNKKKNDIQKNRIENKGIKITTTKNKKK